MITWFPKVADCTAIAHHQSLETPFITKNLLKQSIIATTWVTIPTLIGTHHLSHLPFLHKRLEGREIGFVEVAWRNICDIELMAVPLRSTMNGEVLGTSKKLAILAVGRTLKSSHHSQTHAGSEIRVFTVGFLPTSPTWVTEDVDVRSPERKTLVHLHQSALRCKRCLGTCLIAHSGIDLVDECIVERCSHSHRDGEHRGIAITPHSMQCLVPPVELRNAQTRNGWRVVLHESRFFLQR